MSKQFLFTVLCAGACLALGVATAAQAADETVNGSPFHVKGSSKVQSIVEDNDDFGTSTNELTESYSADVKLGVGIDIAPSWDAYLEGRALKAFGALGSESDTGSQTAVAKFLEWRQSWIRYSDVGGLTGLDIQAGRQRIREDRSLWWNKDFDAVRVNYDSTVLKGFVGVGENLRSYRSSHDDFNEDQQDRLRLMAEGSWLMTPQYRFDVRGLYEDDHSGDDHIGDLFSDGNVDGEDQNLFWGGFRASGTFEPTQSAVSALKYRVDGIVVTGEEKLITTTAAGTGLRSVSDVQDLDVFGYAVDASADLTVEAPLKPTFTLGYAFGSGDDDANDGTDHEFRQSDLHGNTSRMGSSSSTIHNYGEVLRPELGNLHVVTAGVGIPVMAASDVNLVYHYYRLADKSSDPRSIHLSGSTNGDDAYLGQEVDLVLNIDVDEELKSIVHLPLDTGFKFSNGVFKAGDAFGAGEDENAYRGFAELVVRF
jgi:hypothetical protein